MLHWTSGRAGLDELHFESAKSHFHAISDFVLHVSGQLDGMSLAEAEEQLFNARQMLHKFFTKTRSAFTERDQLTVQISEEDCHELRMDEGAAAAESDGMAAQMMVDDAFSASMAAAVQAAASQRS